MTKPTTRLLNMITATAFSVSTVAIPALFTANAVAESAAQQVETTQLQHATQTAQPIVLHSAEYSAQALAPEAALQSQQGNMQEAGASAQDRASAENRVSAPNSRISSARNQPECLQCHATGDKK